MVQFLADYFAVINTKEDDIPQDRFQIRPPSPDTLYGSQHRPSQTLVRWIPFEIVIRSNSVSRKRIFLKKIHSQRELNYLPCQMDGNFLTNGNRVHSIRFNWQKLMVRLIGQVFSIIFIKKKINIIRQALFWFQGKFQTIKTQIRFKV